MYTIEAADWEDVKVLWTQWRTYDLNNRTPQTLATIDRVWVNPDDLLKFKQGKTFVFLSDGVPLGCLKLIDFSSFHPRLRVVGIGNVAVDHSIRGSGVGKHLMRVADLYIRVMGYDVAMLYQSEYSKLSQFYENLGYRTHEKIMLRYYGDTILSNKELNEVVKKIGKF